MKNEMNIDFKITTIAFYLVVVVFFFGVNGCNVWTLTGMKMLFGLKMGRVPKKWSNTCKWTWTLEPFKNGVPERKKKDTNKHWSLNWNHTDTHIHTHTVTRLCNGQITPCLNVSRFFFPFSLLSFFGVTNGCSC